MILQNIYTSSDTRVFRKKSSILPASRRCFCLVRWLFMSFSANKIAWIQENLNRLTYANPRNLLHGGKAPKIMRHILNNKTSGWIQYKESSVS